MGNCLLRVAVAERAAVVIFVQKKLKLHKTSLIISHNNFTYINIDFSATSTILLNP